MCPFKNRQCLMARNHVLFKLKPHYTTTLLRTTARPSLCSMNSRAFRLILRLTITIACIYNTACFAVTSTEGIAIALCVALNSSNSSIEISVNCFWGRRAACARRIHCRGSVVGIVWWEWCSGNCVVGIVWWEEQ